MSTPEEIYNNKYKYSLRYVFYSCYFNLLPRNYPVIKDPTLEKFVLRAFTGKYFEILFCFTFPYYLARLGYN